MAEGKKSFVLYCDWAHHISLLTYEEAGKLFKHLLDYVNDKNPEFEEHERLLKVAFEPIKQQLKRDLKKYESIKEKRAEAGKKGGLKSASNAKIDEQREANQANASFVKQTIANQAVNDNVNDNVNVNVSTKVDVVEESTSTDISKKLDGSFAETEGYRKEIENNINTMKSQVSWKTDIAKAHGLSSLEDADFWIDQYRTHILTISKPDVGISELKRHFNNWLRKQDKTKIVSIQRPMTPQEKREARSKRFN